MAWRMLALLVAGSLTASACIEFRGTAPAQVTPQPVPEELQGARWSSTPLNYCVVRSDAGFVDYDELVRLTEDAFSRWQIEAINDGECEGSREQGNGRNEVTWGAAAAAELDGHRLGNTALLYRQTLNGPVRIVEADILIDPEPESRLRNSECLMAVLLHESGHFFGLPHLPSPAVMQPVSTSCDQELTEADRKAMTELYDLEPVQD